MKFNQKVLSDRIKVAYEFDPLKELAQTYYNEGLRSCDIDTKCMYDKGIEYVAVFTFQNYIRDLEVANKE